MRSLLLLLPACLLAALSPAEEYVFQDGPRLPRVLAASAVAELADGGAVSAGGFYGSFPAFDLNAVLRFQPASGTWVNAGTLSVARGFATATRLASGQVLFVGGVPSSGTPITAVDRFDPATNLCQPALPLQEARHFHSATLLADGRVLVLGGGSFNGGNALASGELYDPGTGTWTSTAPMPHARAAHTALRLPDGRVFVVGGRSAVFGSPVAEVDIYQPATDTWVPGAPLTQGGADAAVLLNDGRILALSGDQNGSCEVFDPATGVWTPVGSTAPGNNFGVYRLPSGRVLALRSSEAEVFDPATATWAVFGPLQVPRTSYGSALLTDGRVLLVGGFNQFVSDGDGILDSTEILAPRTGGWLPGPDLAVARWGHTATVLSDGRILVAGGLSAAAEQSSCEIFDPATQAWSPTGGMLEGRGFHAAVRLPDGKVLVAGGRTAGSTALASAEVYDPATGQWHGVGPLSSVRVGLSAIVLPNGDALFCGGGNFSESTAADLYHTATETMTSVGPMNSARSVPTLALLPNGKVLVAAGEFNVQVTSEIFDPATATFTPAASLRADHRSSAGAPLASGKVLVTGGYTVGTGPATTELYDPATGTWTVAARHVPIALQRTVQLADGQLLASGGYAYPPGGQYPRTDMTRLFDPTLERWSEGAPMLHARAFHQLVLLPDQRVLAIGGGYYEQGNLTVLASCEFFTPSVQAAAPVIGALQQQPGGVQLNWQGAAPRRAYRIEFAPSPAAPWQAFPGVQSSNAAGQLSFLDATLPAPTARFYRTVLLP